MATAVNWISYHCYNPERASKHTLFALLAQLPYEENEILCEHLPSEEVCLIEDYKWSLTCDGPTTHHRGGQELCFMLLIAPMFLCHSNSVFLAQTMKLNMNL